MGQDVADRRFTREDRARYRQKVRRCLDVFARMLAESRFDAERRSMGLEIELNLTDSAGDPAMVNDKVLGLIADPDFQTELAQFNIEINIPPKRLDGPVFELLETDVRASLNHADDVANDAGADVVMIGILPTVRPEHLTEDTISANPRYALLNEQVFAARGEDIELAIDGIERIATTADTIAPEAACTSVQLHLQVNPETFAAHWNASQAIGGVQLALGANSPFFFGKELWRETRIALFEQAADTRSDELKAQGVRPRVWFGERWITSIFDLFEENVRYFPSLLPDRRRRGPGRGAGPRRRAAAGRAAAAQRHDLPLEPAGLRRGPRPAAPAGREPLPARRPDRRRRAGQRGLLLRAGQGARRGRPAGVVADVLRGGGGELPQRGTARYRRQDLLAGHRRGAGDRAGAAPSAAAWPSGGSRSGASRRSDTDRLLGIIEGRCLKEVNGASWQAATFHRLFDDHDRPDALREMMRGYVEHMHSNEPVHTWPS